MVYVKLMDKRYLRAQGTREMDKKAAGREEEQHEHIEQQRQLPRPTMISETC